MVGEKGIWHWSGSEVHYKGLPFTFKGNGNRMERLSKK